MRRLTLATVILGAALLAGGCVTAGVSSSEPDTAPQIDREAARSLSDAFVADVIADRRADLYGRMASGFRDEVAVQDIGKTLDLLYASCGGRPVEAEFKSEESGFEQDTGGRAPSRTFWYAIRTPKYSKGTYFLFTKVIQDGDRLACWRFSIVRFTNGVPDAMK